MFPVRFAASALLAVIFMGPTGCYATKRSREQGKILFEQHCCGCHNGRQLAVARIPPNLAGIFQQPNLPSGVPASDAMVRSTILEGRSGVMPSFEASLSDREIEDIIRYLHSIGPEKDLCASD